MHELGIMFRIVEQVLELVEKNKLSEVEAVVLQVGALSPVIPKYLMSCYGAAASGSLLETAELEIETLPANGKCRSCGKVYDVVENRRACPCCGADDFELLSGRELFIKEIRAR